MKQQAPLVSLLAALVLAGCGEAVKDTATSEPSTTEGSKPAAEKPKPKVGSKAAVIQCLDGLAYDVHAAGNATRVDSPGGRAIANITFHATRSEAEAFDAQLEVPSHATRGRAVGIFLDGAKDRDVPVVTDCLAGKA